MSLFSGLGGWFGAAPPLTDTERAAIARAVKAVDPMLASVAGFERRLAPALRRARDYCAELVLTIPGPVDIDELAFCCDPLVHACFATPGDIAAMFGKSLGWRDFLATPATHPGDSLFALLGMRRHEKNVMGMAVKGDVLQRDVPQRLLYFTDHTLVAVCADLPGIRANLQQLGVDSLVGSFAAGLSARRRERDALRGEREMARAQAGSRGDSAAASEHRRRLDEIDLSLRQLNETFDPERIVAALSLWLAEPEAHLRLDRLLVSVDQMGVEAQSSPDGGPVHELQLQELHFFELVGRDRRHWIVLLARISRAAAMRALAAQLAAEQRSALELQDSRYLII